MNTIHNKWPHDNTAKHKASTSAGATTVRLSTGNVDNPFLEEVFPHEGARAGILIGQDFLSEDKNTMAVVYHNTFPDGSQGFGISFGLYSNIHTGTLERTLTHCPADKFISACLSGNGYYFYILTKISGGCIRLLIFDRTLGSWMRASCDISAITAVLRDYSALSSCGEALTIETSYDGSKLILGEPCYGRTISGRVLVFNKAGNTYIQRQELRLPVPSKTSTWLSQFGRWMQYEVIADGDTLTEHLTVETEDKETKVCYQLDKHGKFQHQR